MNDRLSRGEAIGLILLLALHTVVLPLGIGIASVFSPRLAASGAWANFLYYSISFALTFLVGGRFLRRSFDSLADNISAAVKCILLSFVLYYALTFAVTALMSLIPFLQEGNPNQSAVADFVELEKGPMIAAVVFMAPVVEEVIFRGCVFCGLYRKSRVAAYLLSIAAFSLYHVWQFALLEDVRMLLYALQYIPASFVLCRLYEKSGTIWAGIFFHMVINGIAVAVVLGGV